MLTLDMISFILNAFHKESRGEAVSRESKIRWSADKMSYMCKSRYALCQTFPFLVLKMG